MEVCDGPWQMLRVSGGSREMLEVFDGPWWNLMVSKMF